MDKTKQYLSILVNEMHSVVCATLDDQNRPATRVIDIMLTDGHTLYFLTAKGKDFYKQLITHPFIALTGMSGGEGMDRMHATMQKKSISIRGSVECIGTRKLKEIFEKNPYMAEIYPTEKSREALVVFKMTAGTGEFFDLSTKPITRESFSVGAFEKTEEESHVPYLISLACTGCGKCLTVCPQNCIRHESVPFKIDQAHCLHCGNCFTDCPAGAVIRR
ncbi:4Fe-4S binding protein [Catenisphaera adipataccumulans]|uniref:Putative pyridoxamine 5'-phosphate oxidase family protein n=1 Tax=Catenisphaera adipataccumulans TaxID=700500 RepID=A0A7W8FVZ5_9FIRM|nr:4Fe-4S binding protein [Catenisphaera adipataccumulans]MBB5182155.1 putative pyridoxamine 5'-phosphate oxidase family protein [Catenisphaera adipataccumulans]